VITAVDSNVVFDVIGANPEFGPASLRAIGQAQKAGVVMACDIVWGEVGAVYPTPQDAADAMELMDIRFAALDPEVAAAAGRVWRAYRDRRRGRDRLLPDFLIGTHAWMRADALITRDRGFYRLYFKRLKIVDPSSG
jgi:predicted nucleic acid-binding protein